MANPYASGCDEILMDRYLDGNLELEEKAQMTAHLERCPQCRRQVAAMTTFAEDFHDRVQHVTDSVDFIALEKQVLTKALRQHRSRVGSSTFLASLKYTLPAAVTAGLLLFFAYTNFVAEPAKVPSAIIKSFTGSMSSVMIFETPETRQTILWYNEVTDEESEQNPD